MNLEYFLKTMIEINQEHLTTPGLREYTLSLQNDSVFFAENLKLVTLDNYQDISLLVAFVRSEIISAERNTEAKGYFKEALLDFAYYKKKITSEHIDTLLLESTDEKEIRYLTTAKRKLK